METFESFSRKKSNTEDFIRKSKAITLVRISEVSDIKNKLDFICQLK